MSRKHPPRTETKKPNPPEIENDPKATSLEDPPEGNKAKDAAAAAKPAKGDQAAEAQAGNETAQAEEVTDDPVNDLTLEEERRATSHHKKSGKAGGVSAKVEYRCKTEGGKHFALILHGDKVLAEKEAPTKYDAMLLRDKAKGTGAITFPA